jgi:Tfp pilus assembly protein PilF
LQGLAEIYIRQSDPQSAHYYATQSLQVIMGLRGRGMMGDAAPDSVFADIHALVGMCFLLQGRYEEAQALAGQALSEDEGCHWAHNIFGRIYLQQGKIVPAMRSFSASLRLKPDQPDIQRWLEEALAQWGQ